MSTNEPTWPSETAVITAAKNLGDGGLSHFGVRTAIDMCRAAWLAANDDPAADLPGTVRLGPGGDVVIRISDGTDICWIRVEDVSPRFGRWLGHDEVKGWTRGAPVPGTPAAEAQQ